MTSEYVTPLVERWATDEMKTLWGPRRKFETWRKCWIALAEAEQELGLDITEAGVVRELTRIGVAEHVVVKDDAAHASESRAARLQVEASVREVPLFSRFDLRHGVHI